MTFFYKKVPSIIFTSATLALRGRFRYFMDQSGLSLVEEGGVVTRIVDSPFDYDTQSRLFGDELSARTQG